MIDKELKDKAVTFELSLGKYGNLVDGKGDKAIITANPDSDDSEDEESNPSANLLKKRREEEDRLLCNSSTEPRVPLSHDNTHYYIPFEEKKPCLFVCALFEDLRKRLYHCNLLESVADTLVRAISYIQTQSDTYIYYILGNTKSFY